MRLAAHGLSLELAPGWSGRVFRRAGGNATLHAGSFALAMPDGEFGDASTALMPPGGTFLALAEYLPGAGLQAGRGLFASRRIPARLDPAAFSPARLAHPRRDQAGMQHFFTHAGRPFCLYVVLGGRAGLRRRQLPVLDQVLRTLEIAPGRAGDP